MKKSQIFSVDFLVSILILVMALGLFVNSYSQIQRHSTGTIMNASAQAIAMPYYANLSQGLKTPQEMGCLTAGSVVTCNACVSSAQYQSFETVQRLYSAGGNAMMLRVVVCS